MKKIMVEKHIALYEKLIILSVTGLGTQGIMWVIRYLDQDGFSNIEWGACLICIFLNAYFLLCCVYNFILRVRLFRYIDTEQQK